ncbi:MAG TPA: aminopeptidase, partial [Planctomycetota bacterium]|nr:aminopeptidase [Planctomycetota bacterium]
MALGLLEPEPRAPATRVPVDPPVGEAVSLPGEGGKPARYEPQQPLPTAEVAEHGAPKVRFE